MGITKRIKRAIKVYCYRNRQKNCRIGEGVIVNNARLGDYVTIFDNVILNNVSIGDYSYVQSSSNLNNCSVGKFCSIAPGVVIAPGKHNPKFTSTSALFFSEHPKLPITFKAVDFNANEEVKIGNDVWLGINAVILDGVKIGDGAIVAAGAVVNKDVEPYSIVGGIPAKHIRYRFSDEDIELLRENPWWEHTRSWFEKNKYLIVDLEKYKEYVKTDKKD